MIDNQQLMVLNKKPDHGMWTRVNRKNLQERSIIDYIITTEGSKKNFTNVIVDEEGALRLKGKNESDHNTITTTIKVNQAKRPKFIKKWNLNNKEGWKEFNQKLEKELSEADWKNQQSMQEKYNSFEKALKKTLAKTIGESKIRTDKPPKRQSDTIKKLKLERKRTKTTFGEACKNGTPKKKKGTKELYEKPKGTKRTDRGGRETETGEKTRRDMGRSKKEPKYHMRTKEKNQPQQRAGI